MFTTFLVNLVDKDSFKKSLSSEEMKNTFAQSEGVYVIQSPIMYKLYTMYSDSNKITERSKFFKLMGAYCYYDKFPCKHGEEFYYYIKFNENSAFYQEHKMLIDLLTLEADPSTLKDYIGTRDLTIYNKFLKEKKQS